MTGIWLAAMIAALMAAGVVTQLGWEPIPAVKRVLRRGGSRTDS
jgi:hypothetical protein